LERQQGRWKKHLATACDDCSLSS